MILTRAVSVEIVNKNITGLYVTKKTGKNMRCKGAQACRKMGWKVELKKKYNYDPNEHRP